MPDDENHIHEYYRYHPRGFGNEYTVVAIPRGADVEEVLGIQHRDPVDYMIHRRTRDEALKDARWTAPEHATQATGVRPCPECYDDALADYLRSRSYGDAMLRDAKRDIEEQEAARERREQMKAGREAGR